MIFIPITFNNQLKDCVRNRQFLCQILLCTNAVLENLPQNGYYFHYYLFKVS